MKNNYLLACKFLAFKVLTNTIKQIVIIYKQFILNIYFIIIICYVYLFENFNLDIY